MTISQAEPQETFEVIWVRGTSLSIGEPLPPHLAGMTFVATEAEKRELQRLEKLYLDAKAKFAL